MIEVVEWEIDADFGYFLRESFLFADFPSERMTVVSMCDQNHVVDKKRTSTWIITINSIIIHLLRSSFSPSIISSRKGDFLLAVRERRACTCPCKLTLPTRNERWAAHCLRKRIYQTIPKTNSICTERPLLLLHLMMYCSGGTSRVNEARRKQNDKFGRLLFPNCTSTITHPVFLRTLPSFSL